jgi:hypothetical protein
LLTSISALRQKPSKGTANSRHLNFNNALPRRTPPAPLPRTFAADACAGYLFKKLHYPLAPMVLAIVIGDKAEDAFRQSMLMSRGSLGIFFSNTLVTTLVFMGVALLVVPLIWQSIGKMLKRSPRNVDDRAVQIDD